LLARRCPKKQKGSAQYAPWLPAPLKVGHTAQEKQKSTQKNEPQRTRPEAFSEQKQVGGQW
jgi:hypothetical protein